MKRKCINCVWEGELERDPKTNPHCHCPVCGDNTVQADTEEVTKEKEPVVTKTKKTVKKKPRKKKSWVAEIGEIIEDVVDDGKRNYSPRRRNRRSKK